MTPEGIVARFHPELAEDSEVLRLYRNPGPKANETHPQNIDQLDDFL